MRRIFVLGALLYSATLYASPWVFDQPLPVTALSAQNVFTHLESAGRKNIALSAGWVALVWEDNRDGVPRCYVALKGPAQAAFGKALQISGKEEAAEPAIVGMEGGRFAMAWEEAGHILVRSVQSTTLGAVTELGKTQAGQASLGFATGSGLYVVWSEAGKQFRKIKLAQLKLGKAGLLHITASASVDSSAKGDQAYPSIAVLAAKKVVVGWEDRRSGHTRIFSALSLDNGLTFLPASGLNEFKWRGKDFNYGSGTGAMRVALSASGPDGAVAVWADKRDFQSGYDVYAALASGMPLKFAANEKVQDEFGNNIAQWHPAVAANARGLIAAVWDDDRDGTPDVWLSWRNADGWADNLALPGAAGPGVQSDPSIALDEAGNLYVAWVEKADLNAPSSIRYVMGHAQ